MAAAWLRIGGVDGHGTVGESVPVRVTGAPFDEQRLPGVRERQVPGCGQDLGGADVVPETHLRVGTTLRGKYVIVALG